MNIFELENISFAYNQNVVVFNQISFSVRQGDFVALVGPNGAGKSTLLKLCVGLLKPQSGQVRLFGEPVSRFDGWAKIGYVPQNPLKDRQFPVTVEEIVAMGRTALVGMGRSLRPEDKAGIDNALHLTGLNSYRHRMIGQLSGGQQQRAFVARALASRPEVLALDEPTAGVDALARDDLYSLLAELNAGKAVTIAIVSHDVDVISRYATQVACINHGVTYYGEPGRSGNRTAQNQEINHVKAGNIVHA
ncbi:metal ABC transporter ATP-binding protein [Acetonema longum]|uniref:Iron ABC transporter permease n=1 Tax=Acetonema longum DSM 6540 TaxID=1009370 RepID=F7NDL3_9FIRM|nr:metal ABC transporter ATP-binding protein [Acetonema longum]EGO65875.1 iron ABC transporter permease [Acetonema longum DSM 6540]